MYKNDFSLLLALIWYTTWPYQLQFYFLLYFSVQYGGHFEFLINYIQLWAQHDSKCLKMNSPCSNLSFDILHDHINWFFKCYQFFHFTYGGHFEFWPNSNFNGICQRGSIANIFDNDMKYVHAKFGASITMCMIWSKNQIKQLD